LAWFLAIDAIIATYIAALVLMNALVGITSLVTRIETPWWGSPDPRSSVQTLSWFLGIIVD
jgi:hypothetical protein